MARRELRGGIPMRGMSGSSVRGTEDGLASCGLAVNSGSVSGFQGWWLVALEDAGQSGNEGRGQHPSRRSQRPRTVQRGTLRDPGALLAEAEDRYGYVCGIGECVEGRRMIAGGDHVSTA